MINLSHVGSLGNLGLPQHCMEKFVTVLVLPSYGPVVEMRGGQGGLNPPNVQGSVQILEIWKQMCKF